MDKIQFTFPCLIVLLGLVLTSTTTAQTQPVNLTVTQPTSASNPANDTATPGHTTAVDNYDLTFSAITPSLPDQIFDNISITNSTGRPNHTVTTTLETSSDASPGPTSWPSPSEVSTSKPPAEASSTTASTSATSTTKDTGFAGTAQPKPPAGKSSTVIGLIMLIVIIITTCVIGAACFFTKKTSRRYSVDLRDRHEDLPLSTVDSDAVFDNSTQKGMDTFAAVDLNTTEVLLVKGSEGEREDEKISDYPPPASPVDKPDDGAPEAPVGETDDENTVSNKTSVEANENNNNTTVTTARIASTTPRGRAMTSSFSEVPLDNPA